MSNKREEENKKKSFLNIRKHYIYNFEINIKKTKFSYK